MRSLSLENAISQQRFDCSQWRRDLLGLRKSFNRLMKPNASDAVWTQQASIWQMQHPRPSGSSDMTFSDRLMFLTQAKK
jgi:hypothetical protein